MTHSRHVLIVKHGALGDVVRTSYFARSLKEKYGDGLRLSWLAAPSAVPLLRFNPYVDDLWTSFADAGPYPFDQIYSLDDERSVLDGVAALRATKITGAYLGDDGNATYSPDSASWFDMGLLSRFGKARADELKKLNKKGHAEIFRRIFDVERVEPGFYGNDLLSRRWKDQRLPGALNLCINPHAGGRWPSKALRADQLALVISRILEGTERMALPARVTLSGCGKDRRKNEELIQSIGDERVTAADTEESPLQFAALIHASDYVISSDSLGMHLSVAQRVPFLAFFSPTSADEIDDFGMGEKLVSASPDYCTYRKDADNRTITADRLLTIFWRHASSVGLLPYQAARA
jgi:heptosyltransferase-2